MEGGASPDSLVVKVAFDRQERRGPDLYTLSDAGLEISGSEDLVLMSWSSMSRVHETDRLFVFVAGSEVQYLPKRVLDQERVDLVRGLIARHGPGKRIPAAT